jgi:hypothetical protein
VPCAEPVTSVDPPDEQALPIALPETGQPAGAYGGVSLAGLVALLAAALVLSAALVSLRRRGNSRSLSL